MINKFIVSGVYAVGIFLFLLLCHPELLVYYEQYQLFLFNADYLCERLSVAGGVADYISEFLVQFCYIPFAGAMVLTLVFVVLQMLMSRLLCRISSCEVGYPLSLVPGILLLGYMGDEDVMPSFVVAVVLMLLAVWGVLCVRPPKRFFAEVVVVPFLYWCAGPVVFCYVALMMICDESDNVFSLRKVLFCILRALYSILVVWLAYRFILTQYVVNDVWMGINYHRDRMTYPVMQFVVQGAIVFIPLLARLLIFVHVKFFGVIMSTLFLVGGYFFVTSNYNRDKFAMIYFNACVRHEQWNDIIRRAEKYMPQSDLASNCVNLALAKTGVLGDRMFEFYQCGADGLFLKFSRNMVSCLPTAEAYYQLGMVNEALRCFFDSQESILNCYKSGYITRRIAELYIVNGDYKIARKYLVQLRETFFYSKWAEDMLSLLGNEKAIEAHPSLGRLRKSRYDVNFFFNPDVNFMLASLWTRNKQNTLAFDYLVGHILLTCDMKAFYNIAPELNKIGFSRLPRHYREVVAMFQMNEFSLGEGLEPDLGTLKEVKDFNTAYLMASDRKKMLKSKWKDTFWTYCLVTYPSLNVSTGATRIK